MNADESINLRVVPDRDCCEKRLKLIFPPAAFDAVLSNPLAASSVSAMIYVGAVVGDEGDPQPENVWARPQTVLGMSDEALARTSVSDRLTWAAAAARGYKPIGLLLGKWGVSYDRWYAPDSREGLRDETWPKWRNYGAVRNREGVTRNASWPRWALTASFADLFNPDLSDAALTGAIERWRSTHMSPGDRLRIQFANDLAQSVHLIPVFIPGYGIRNLEPGIASAIIRGIIEEWAPRRLSNPLVVAISEPGTKVWVIDKAKMAAAGISINVSSVLPDVIILDAGIKPSPFWIIEAVATDGEINENRKADLLTWAQDQYIDPELCHFVSAFSSRNSPPARKRLKDIAVGTYCWFLDEPDCELAWNEISQ
ncbi:MAG: BsuBI/PstI family type II restriction endonuclease [Streptosporangiaceae bacterium]|jgi:hypothetical protein